MGDIKLSDSQGGARRLEGNSNANGSDLKAQRKGAFKNFSIKQIFNKKLDSSAKKEEVGKSISKKIATRQTKKLKKKEALQAQKSQNRFDRLFMGISGERSHAKFNETVDKLRKEGNFEGN